MSDEFRAVLASRDGARAQFITAMNHAAAMLDNGERVLVTVGPATEPITVKQRKFLHGPVLGQISEQVRVNGERFVIEIWKEYFRKLYLPDRFESRKLPGQKRATPQRVRQSTEDLGVKFYSEFIDQVIAHAVTEFGVVFRFETGEREAVQYRPPARKQAKEAAPAAASAIPF